MKSPLRKTLSMALCFILVLGTLVPVFADTAVKTDYDTHWARGAIASAVASGLTKGYPDGSFKPENPITRAEFFALVNKAFKVTEAAPASYTDVAADAWYAPVVAKAKAAGYISGYADGSIRPESNITRQEAAVVLSKAKSLKAQNSAPTFSDASAVAAWGKDAVAAASEAKIMSGYPDGSFKPEAQIKRAEALVAITACAAYTAPTVVEAPGKDTVYGKAGSFGSSTETVTLEGNVIIKAPGVILQNTIIKGNLTIAKEVGNGEVTLKSVVVKGNTYVNGGGVNSLYFINVTTGKVYVQRDDGPVRIVASGTSEIDELLAGSDVKLEEVNMTGTGFEGITVEKNAAGGVDITLAGVKCDSIAIKASGVTLNADKASTVSKLTVDAANTQFKGSGKIESAVINAGGVNFETKPVKTETAPGVTAPTIKPAPTAPAGGGGGGGGGGSGGGTPAQTSVTSIGAIIGECKVGAILTAGAVAPAGATVTYQWSRSDTANGVYTSITGATASAYIPGPFDQGKFYKVTASGTGSYSGSVTSVPTAAIGAGTVDLTSIGSVSGTPQAGSVLTAGAVTPAGAIASYQWSRANAGSIVYEIVPGATSSTYTLGAEDIGKRLRVTATGQAPFYSGAVASESTEEVAGYPVGLSITDGNTAIDGLGGNGLSTVNITITGGDLAVGQALSMDISALNPWTAGGLSTGMIYVSGPNGSPATITPSISSNTLTITVANASIAAGQNIELIFHGTTTEKWLPAMSSTASLTAVRSDNAASDTFNLTINTTKYIASVGAITGSLIQGSTLTAGETTVAGALVLYQWSRGDTADGAFTNISNATNKSYVLTTDDLGKYIRVNVKGYSGYYGEFNITTNGTVIAPDTTAPTITGWSFESNHNNIIENDEKIVITFSEPMVNDTIYGNDLFNYLEQIPFTLYAGGRSGQWSDDRTFYIMLNTGSSAPVGSGLKFLHRNIYPFTDRAGNPVDVVNGSPTYTMKSGDF